MKLQIDKYGHLKIERAGKMEYVYCPYLKSSAVSCGDWCVLFEEPKEESIVLTRTQAEVITKQNFSTLKLCKKTYTTEDFEDLREGKKE